VILITGGMGFIGLHTVRRFMDVGETVVLTCFRTRREPSFLADELGRRAIVELLDVTDRAAVLELARRHRPDGIVHLAVPALAGISPLDEYRTNTQGLINVLEAAAETGTQRVSIASSIAVYSGLSEGPFLESAPLPVASTNATEAYKKAEEILSLYFARQSQLDVRCLRLAGIYGPLYHSMANLPSRLCHAAVRGAQPELGPGRYGGPPRADDAQDFCYVRDCAAGIQLVHQSERLQHTTYNIGAGRATTYAELAAAVNAAVPGANIELPPGASPGARRAPYLDISRARQDAGYEPAYDIARGVADYVAWLRHNPQ
jgi:UDP-glucose 4-epimerase